MANIFGILTACVVALSLWVGHKNSVEHENQVQATADAERKLKSSQENQKVILANIKEEEERIAMLSADLEDAKLRPAELDLAIIDLTGQKNTLEKKVKRNGRELDSLNEARETFPDPDVVIPQVKAMKNQIAQLKVDLASEQEVLRGIEEEVVQVKEKAAEYQAINDTRSSGKSLASLATTVKNVYGNWGFVTLNGGNAHGVVSGSTLDVVRDGAVVAKLKVTAVEQNRAAADILPDALPEVVSLRSGDKVVAAK